VAVPAAAQQGSCRVVTPTLQQSYQGECLYGLAHGQGVAQGTDRYQGQFKEGQPHGQGQYSFADGRRFEGEFVAGRVSGRARFFYSNGDVLEGEFRDNRLSGAGRMQQAGQGQWVGVQLTADGRLQRVETAGLAPAPSPGTSPGTSPTPGAVAVQAQWEAKLDFQDVFPSYVFATARRTDASPGAAARGSVANSRGTFLTPYKSADGASSRHALMHAQASYLGDPWGMIGISYTAKRAGERIRLRVEADDIMEPTDAEYQLPQPGRYAIYPKLRYRYDRLKDVQQARPINLRWQLYVDGQFAGQQDRTTTLRALQDAPGYIRGERGEEVMGWVFASFVTEEAPWIDAFLQEAFQGRKVGAIGYQGSEDDVISQVEAVYEALRKRGVRYSSITATAGDVKHLGIFSQTVRLPSQSLRTAQANCVDGTVLMASVLRRIGIESLIVLGPGHAMMGFLTGKDPKEASLMVIETTMLGDAPFIKAAESGIKTFREWKKLPESDPRFQVIRVSEQRRLGVMPIPL
jgi:hypothetical protein